MEDNDYEYGPCHLCGSETPERHGRYLLGPCTCGAHTIEVCAECLDRERSDHPERCPDEKCNEEQS